MSQRRSARARTSQLPPNVPGASSTSTSSVSSARTERAMRTTNHKQSSPHKSVTPHSRLSSEEPHPQPPLTRRRTREHDLDDDDTMKVEDTLEDEEDEQEVTRCVCTFLEYPGPPSIASKSKEGQTSSLTDSDVQNDEGGLFIQCDTCHVWQHGQCVGIMDEASSPEEYFCEECRKDLHKLMTDSKGQKYSRYLPVYEQLHGKYARKSSLSKDAEIRSGRDNNRNARASVESLGKRRSTMNSRAAYDEDEVLRKVLEESKIEGAVSISESGTRKKRSRDESEDGKPEVKRQRTSSISPSNSVIESEDEGIKPATAKQKPRGAAARSQREKELREKERERERTEAANRRKGRAERRKAEELEAAEEVQSEEVPMAPSASESAPPDTPTADLKPAPAPRKSGRPQKRQSRLGRNQYTRDDPTPTANGASPVPNGDTPNSPQISATNGLSNGHESSDGTTGQKSTKTKNWRLDKLSWNEIKRPAGAMQNYIAQRQVEMAGEKTSPAPAVQSPAPTNGEQGQETNADGDNLDGFKQLSTLQMMDDLSRELVHWQRMVAELTEK